MMIDVQNYGAWFLDYHEGNLSVQQVAELFLFLEQHPELKEEFESFELTLLDADDQKQEFPDKNSLKKSTVINETNIEEWLVAEIEGDLQLKERILLNAFMQQHPEFERDRKLFGMTKLIADAKDIYPAKEKLKKHTIRRFTASFNQRYYYAAACLILLLASWFIIRLQKTPEPQTAEKTVPSIQHLPQQPVSAEHKNQVLPSQQDTEKIPAEHVIPQQRMASTAGKKHGRSVPDSSPDESQSAQTAEQRVGSKEQRNRTQPSNLPGQPHINGASSRETIALIAPLTASIPEVKPFVNAQRRYVPGTPAVQERVPVDQLFAEQQAKMLGDIKALAANSVNKITGTDIVGTPDDPLRLTLKSRVIRFAAHLVTKVSGENLRIKTTFNPVNGNIAAYEVAMGKNKWQKQF